MTVPVLAEVTRGPLVESRHRGSAVVVDRNGTVVAAWGEPEKPVYPRSAVKPFQALPLIESGAADRFGLTEKEIALACSSHSGEPVHAEAVAAWLARIGLSAADLECGAHAPLDVDAAWDLAKSGDVPSALHNNCSGKHAGMLTTARHLGEAARGYLAAEHPVQRRVRRAIGMMTGIDAEAAPSGIDGCGIPTVAMPLANLALGFAHLAASDAPPAVARIAAAMMAEPRMVGGKDRFDTLIMSAAPGRLVTKGGAEGVWAAGLVDEGLGIAVKIEDGTRRGAEAAMAGLLARFAHAIPATVLDRFAAAPVLNVAGRPVGLLRSVLSA
jgi:L-asparaginase II